MGPGMMFSPVSNPMAVAGNHFAAPFLGNGVPATHFPQLGQHNLVSAQPAGAITHGIDLADAEQFSDAFNDFANARFEDDVAEASAPHVATGAAHSHDAVSSASDFQAEMDKWMAENHPRVETKDYYMDDVTDTMKSIALEQEAKEALAEENKSAEDGKAQNDHELKRAAASILDSVADNTSQKFQQSSFLALMKRIAEEKVVLKGEDLVEAATGVTYKVTIESTEE